MMTGDEPPASADGSYTPAKKKNDPKPTLGVSSAPAKIADNSAIQWTPATS
jgi:hypothetical protein